MRSLNKVMLIGNVGKQPEVNFTSSGIPVAKFSIATTESFKDKDGNYSDTTEWHNIVAWRGLAEYIGKNVNKGSKIYIEGRLKHRSYDDKDGIKRYLTEVLADEFVLLDPRKTDGDTSATEESSDMVDDIPF